MRPQLHFIQLLTCFGILQSAAGQSCQILDSNTLDVNEVLALCDQLPGQLFSIPKGGFLATPSITTEDGFGQVVVQADLVDGSGLPNSDAFSAPADINNIGPFDGLCSQQLSVCVFGGDNPRAHTFTVKDAGTFPDSAGNQIKITFTVQHS
jgi:hypothetical protein